MTEAELLQLIEEQGGEIGGPGQGRYADPKTATIKVRPYPELDYEVPGPNPTPNWIINTRSGNAIVVQPQPDGTYVPINTPAPRGGTTARGTEGGAPYITPGGQLYDPTKNIFTDIPGYRGTQPQGSWQNGVYYGPPGAAIPEALTADPLAIAERQATANRQAAQDQLAAQQAAETARQNAFTNQLAAIKAAEAANEIDAKRAQELRDYVYKTEVEFPAEQLKQQETRLHAGIEFGRQAGAAAVSDITATLPYRYSPGFQARQQAVQAEAARGNFQPGITQSIARSYRGPDLQGARQQAERGYENQYLQQFGFDPMETAGGLGYRAPGPMAAPLAGLADDEDEIKRVAAVLAGGR